MRRSVIADVGPLVAALNERDQYHNQAQQDLRALDSEGFQVAILATTISEAYSFILRRGSLYLARRWLAQIEAGASIIVPEEGEYRAALHVVLRYPDQDITIFDALVVLASHRLRLPVWTYDHHFDILGAQRWRPGG